MTKEIDYADLQSDLEQLDARSRRALSLAISKEAEDTYGIMTALIRTDKTLSVAERTAMLTLAQHRRDLFDSIARNIGIE